MQLSSINHSIEHSIVPSASHPIRLLLQRCIFPVFLLFVVQICAPLHADETTTERGSFTGAADATYPDWFKVSFMELEEDIAEAAEEGKRLMLLFHQNGCPYCNAFVEKNLTQVDIVETLKSKFDVIELNMWGDREVVSVDGTIYTEKEFAKALDVQFTPSIIFLTEEGKVALRLNGYYGPDRFRLVLEYVAGKMEKQLSFNEFIESKAPSDSSKSLTNRNYFTGPVSELNKRPGKNNKPLLLMFEQGSCANCEVLHDSILSTDESQSLLNEFDVYQIDMWSQDTFKTPDGDETTGRQWSQALNVSYAPTMIIYSSDGTEVIRAESSFKTFHIQSLLDYVSSDKWREEPSFQRYISARADEQRDNGTNVNIWD